MRERILGISRIRARTDGEGIVTLAVFWGCPLRCRYCLNDFCHDPNTWMRIMSPEELYEAVKIDDPYYRMTNGGVTFGGGEPLLYAGFIRRFADIAPDAWKIRVETSLNVEWSAIEPLTGIIDRWYIDIKDMNPEIYACYTGADNAAVKDNLARLYHTVGGGKIHLRIPNIPGFNRPEDVRRSRRELADYNCVKEEFTYIFE